MKTTFCGVIPPMLTIFNEDGSISWDGNKILIDYLIKNKVHGIFVLGSSGEFNHLTIEERMRFAEFAVRYIDGRVPVLVGTGSSNTKTSVELSIHAKSIGADGVVVVCPYYWSLSDENLYHHFATIARSVDIPIIIYNFPSVTGQNISPDLVLRLASDFENIVGIKDTIDSISHISEIIIKVKQKRPDFCVLAGYDDHLLNTLAMGGDGAIPGTSNFVPELSVRLYESFIKGNFDECIKLHKKLMRLARIYSYDKPSVKLLKEACRLCGVDVPTFARQPANYIEDSSLKKLEELLHDCELMD